MKVLRTPILDSEAVINEQSHDDTGESCYGDIPSSERYDQKEQVRLELELGSELDLESEGNSGCW